MTFKLPPENIITSRLPGGVEVSTCRYYATGRYETKAFLPDGGIVEPTSEIIDFTLSDALRRHAEAIDILAGSKLDVMRDTVKIDISDRE